MLVIMAAWGDAPGPPNNTLLSHANRAGASGVVAVDGLNLSLAKDHGACFRPTTFASQEGRSALFSAGRVDSDSAATIVDLIGQIGSRATRSGVIVPLLELSSSDTACGHDSQIRRSQMLLVVVFCRFGRQPAQWANSVT